jgi:hypothetical protein
VDESELRPETGCCDLTFAEHEQSCLEKLGQGDQGALLHFIDFCFLQRRDVPAWAREKFREAIGKVRSFEVKSWDEVFGRPLKKGKQLAALRRRSEALSKVWKLVNARRRAGEALDKRLFEAVGREVGIGGATVVEKMYYELLAEFRESAEAAKYGTAKGPLRTITFEVKDIFEPPFDPHEDR